VQLRPDPRVADADMRTPIVAELMAVSLSKRPTVVAAAGYRPENEATRHLDRLRHCVRNGSAAARSACGVGWFGRRSCIARPCVPLW
jgi:hypothetical protein